MISMTLPGEFRELGFLSRGNRMCKASKVLNVCVGGWDSLCILTTSWGAARDKVRQGPIRLKS